MAALTTNKVAKIADYLMDLLGGVGKREGMWTDITCMLRLDRSEALMALIMMLNMRGASWISGARGTQR